MVKRAQSGRKQQALGAALVLVAALLALVPELVRGCSCGHDFDFHLLSWMDALRAWREGIFYPHWTASANWGAGEPRFVFYPPLTWMLGALLGAVLPWTAVPVVLSFLLLAATGLGARSMAREWLGEAQATLAGCVAVFSGYTLFTLYERTAFAEAAGGLWMALLLKFALRERRGQQSGTWARALDGSALPLALTICGAWLSNPTVAVMACYLLAAVAALASVLRKSWAAALRAAVAVPLGLGLAAFYLAPVAGEQGWANLNSVNLSPGQMLSHNWLFARNADPVLAFHDAVLAQVSWVAVAMIATTLLAALLCLRRGRLTMDQAVWLPLALLPVVVLLLLLPASAPLWNLLPKLRYLQFPWRWLVALEAPLGLFVALACWPPSAPQKAELSFAAQPSALAVAGNGKAAPAPRNGSNRLQPGLTPGQRAAACAFLLAFVALGFAANRWFFQPCADEDAPAGLLAAWQSGLGLRGMDEYVPIAADNDVLAQALPMGCLVLDPLATLGQPQPPAADAAPDDDPPPPLWRASDGSCLQSFAAQAARSLNHHEHLQLSGVAQQAGALVLHLRRYPAWRVQLNGQWAKPIAERADGLLVVAVPAGPLRLTVDWQTTPDQQLGRLLTLLSVLLLTVVGWLERRLAAARLK